MKKAEYMALAEAASDMLEKYVALANSGDAGFWDPEKVPEVIALRAALVNAFSKPGGPR